MIYVKKLICLDNEGMEKILKLDEEYEYYDEDDSGYLVVLEDEVKWLRKNRFKKVENRRYLDMLWFLLGISILLIILEKVMK